MGLSVSAVGQHVNLFWYNLKSIQPLSQEQGKVAVKMISELTDDSLLTFNAKSSMFSLATYNPVDFDSLSSQLNQSGFYIANVTGGLTHQSEYVKSGFNFQAAIFLLLEHEQFMQAGIDSVILNSQELSLLEEMYQINPNDYSVIVLSEE